MGTSSFSTAEEGPMPLALGQIIVLSQVGEVGKTYLGAWMEIGDNKFTNARESTGRQPPNRRDNIEKGTTTNHTLSVDSY
jgi:hypothetical protein